MIWIYEQGHEDFSTNGLGMLIPTKCEISEEQAGAYELEMSHPMDEGGIFELLKAGRVIKAPVPAQTTPMIQMEAAEGYEIWEVISKAKVYTKKTTSLGSTVTVTVPAEYDTTYIRPETVILQEEYTTTRWQSNGNRALETLKVGANVNVLSKSGGWYRVTTENGNTGWVQADKVTLIATIPSAPPETIQARKTREQLFRIYRTEKDTETGEIRVWARHISYDLLANVIIDCNLKDVAVGSAVAALSANCTQQEHGFAIYTNSSKTITADYSRKGFLEAVLNPDEGIAALANLRVVRDNYDIFLLERSTTARQPITYGQNLMGVTVDINEDGIINRIVPVGKTKDGEPLYIDTTYTDSPRNNEATVIKANVIEYDVEESEDMTLAQAKAKLEELAQKDFESGLDLPDISVRVNFLQLGDTVEYAAYRDLDRLYLGDLITVRDDAHDVELDAEITQVDYDVLTNRYIHMSVGVTEAARTIGSTASFMLPNGSLGGRKIALGSLDGGHLKGASISGSHIQDSAITNSHFMNGTISGSIFEDGTITGSKFEDGTIENTHIKNGTITGAKIYGGSADDLYLTNSNFANGKISGSWIDSSTLTNIPYAQIKDLDVTGDAIFRQSVLGDGTFYLDRLIVNSANIGTATIGELMVRDAQGKLHKVLIGTNGVVSSEEVKVDGQNLSNDAMMQVSQRLVWRQEEQPSAPFIGMIWMDTSLTPAGKPKEILRRCTAIAPSVVWEVVQSNELHTNVIDVDDNGMNILSGGNLNLLSGGAINIKNISGTANVINMDNTGLTLSSTGQINVASGGKINVSADDLIISGETVETYASEKISLSVNEIQVGGRNLVTDSHFYGGVVNGWSDFYGTQIVENHILKKTFTQLNSAARIERKFTNLEAGTYTLTVYAKTPWDINWKTWIGASVSLTQTADPLNFKAYSVTFNVETAGDVTARGYVENIPIGSVVEIDWFTLERGNKATDWAPAPEDPASGVKTSSVEVNTNGIYMDTTGTFNVNAGVGVNIKGGSGASSIGISNNDANNYFLWAGHGTPASAPFSVKMDGSVKATKIQQEYSNSFWDMADSSTPAEFPVYIPSGYTIDSVTFTFQTKKARTFAKAAASGGGVVGTDSGGGTAGIDNIAITVDSASITTSGAPNHTHTTDTNPSGSAGAHNHTNSHSHSASASYSMVEHTHKINLPGHTHGINYGINEKTDLATSCDLKVGATTIGTYSPNPSNPVELKAHMSAGWNTVIVAPNNDARIVAFALVKLTPA